MISSFQAVPFKAHTDAEKAVQISFEMLEILFSDLGIDFEKELGQLKDSLFTAKACLDLIKRHAAVFNVLDYAPVGYAPGVTDATSAFTAVAAALQTNGGGRLVIPPGNYLTHTGSLTTTLGAFSNLNGVSIEGCGATIIVNRTFTSGQTLNLFTFTACKNIQLLDYRIVSPEEAAGTRDTRGIYAHTFLQGCDGIYARNIDQTGGVYGLWFSREYNDPENYRSKNIVVDNYRTKSVGYTFMGRHSGDNFVGSGYANMPHRAFFFYGATNIKIDMEAQDQDACSIIKQYNQATSRNIRINYTNVKSTVASNASGDVEISAHADASGNPGFIKDIDLHLNVDYSNQATYAGPVVRVANYDSGSAYDTVDRGHIFENISISGLIIGQTSTIPLEIGVNGSWGLGNYMRNWRIDNLSTRGTGSGSVYLTSLQDKAVINNLVSDAQMFIKGNKTGIVTCLGCNAVNLTASTGDDSYMDFFGCQITNGSTISKINKNFLPYHVGATYEQMALYRSNAGSSVIARIANGDTGSGSNTIVEVDSNGSGLPLLGVSVNGGNTFMMAITASGQMVFIKGLDPASNKILVVDPTTLEVQFQNDISLGNGATLKVGTSTGTMIGQTGGLLGFLGATPVARQANTVGLDTILETFGFRSTGGVADFTNDVSLASGKVVKINGTQVLTAQQTGLGTALASATAGATYTAAEQTMLNDLNAKAVALETIIRAHGLGAT